MKLRRFEQCDASAVVSIFRASVHALAQAKYSPTQVAAWVRFGDDAPDFADRLAKGYSVVAEIGGEVVAFGQLYPEDHVEMLYCGPAHARRGVASAVLVELERVAAGRGANRVSTEASLVAQPFFERHGYRVIAAEQVAAFGTTLERVRMQKSLACDAV